MASQDTEITLGMGKLLALFFALAALCAVCVGLGYSLGRNSLKGTTSIADNALPSSNTPAKAGTRPAAAANKQDYSFYKAVEQKEPNSKLSEPEPDAAPTPGEEANAAKATAAPEMAHPGSGYIVQVAAVSKQEDAQALADALRKKSYAVVIANNTQNDKLYHVQIGPFADIAEAETTRTRLVGDGYNPILKK
jgi:cell division septation protein DedD